MTKFKQAFLLYNTESGQSKKGQQLEPIKAHFEQHDISLKILQIPVPGEDIHKTLEQVSSDKADLFIAAGGDGTVSLISNKLINTGKPLGILPLGTGNLLAQELKIPLNLDKALTLITADEPKILKMDTIKLEDRCCLLNVSIGLSFMVMKSTQSKEKQRFGNLAYIVNFIQEFLGLKLHRFFIEYDEQNINLVASEVLITNGNSAGVELIKSSEKISLNDGQLDLFTIRATNLYDVFNLVLSLFSKKSHRDDNMKQFQFSDFSRIETQTPLPIQADGDLIGETPLEVKILPKSLKIIVHESFEN